MSRAVDAQAVSTCCPGKQDTCSVRAPRCAVGRTVSQKGGSKLRCRLQTPCQDEYEPAAAAVRGGPDRDASRTLVHTSRIVYNRLHSKVPWRCIVNSAHSDHVWTVAEAKARLSEILRLAESRGPQRIGTRRPFVVVPAHQWDEAIRPRTSLGTWLIEKTPRGTELEIPSRRDSGREIPFISEQGQ